MTTNSPLCPSDLVKDRNVSLSYYELSDLALNKFASHQQVTPHYCKVISSISAIRRHRALASIYLF